MYKAADISEDGQYRYGLVRHWKQGAPRMTFIMLNPYTADAEKDDLTIRKCIKFATREGFGGINVVNLFAYRTTNPRLLSQVEDPIGESNNSYLSVAIRKSKKTVAAWGHHPIAKTRVDYIRRLAVGSMIYCLGQTLDGYPRHPLYVKADQPLELWF